VDGKEDEFNAIYKYHAPELAAIPGFQVRST
jgi:hypothetical protein